ALALDPRGRIGGRPHHRLRERRDPVPVERRLRDAPLPLPEISLAGGKTVAQDVAQRLVPSRLLAVILVVFRVDVIDARGDRDQRAAQRAEAEPDALAVVAKRVAEDADGIAPHRRQAAEHGMAAGAGSCALVAEVEDVREREHAPSLTLA